MQVHRAGFELQSEGRRREEQFVVDFALRRSEMHGGLSLQQNRAPARAAEPIRSGLICFEFNQTAKNFLAEGQKFLYLRQNQGFSEGYGCVHSRSWPRIG